MPFALAERDGVTTLTLDTPRSAVNIFNHATARQLVDVFAGLSTSRTRAVVFESAKPSSFLNGVGLLLAHASRTVEDVVRASDLPWAAYRAVRESPVPTIAVVEGSCFGCGVEFALSCDYRIATDSGETQFYMTELNDYLFLPLFGSTWNLPEAVGLADAIDLLLWGSRWAATEAAAKGLVDEVVPSADRDARTRAFVERVLEGRQPSRRRGRVAWGPAEDDVAMRTRRQIDALPPPYRGVYGDALDLLRCGAEQRGGYLEHQRHELQRSAASALAPIGKAAYSFFYLRQMAAERAAGRHRGAEDPASLCVDLDGVPHGRAFAETLRARLFPGARLGADESADFRLVAAEDHDEAAAGPATSRCRTDRTAHVPGSSAGRDVAVRLAIARGPTADLEIYAPGYAPGRRLIELATTDAAGGAEAVASGQPGAGRDDVSRLARTLQRFGFEVARTTPGESFVTTRLLLAFLRPLVRFVEEGGDASVAGATLRDTGFVRSPGELIAALEERALAVALAPGRCTADGDPAAALAALAGPWRAAERTEPLVLDALCIALLEAAEAARATRAVPDPSVTDLVARELLDFPRHLVSLCTWLKRERVAGALARRGVGRLVTAQAFEAASAFAVGGREFYR
jgi:enoyl-CoA hydratase/carnithine racemase